VNAVFTVTLSLPVDGTVTVDFTTADQTALANVDYRPVSGTLTFEPGESSHTIAVPIIGDIVHELDETFLVSLSAPTLAALLKDKGVGTIVSDPSATLFTFDKVLRTRSFDLVLNGPIRIQGDVQTAGRMVRSPDVVLKGKIQEHAPSAQPALPLPSGAKRLGHLAVAGNQRLTLAAGSYVVETLTLNDTAELTASGPVKIWVRQAVNLSGYARTRVASGHATDLWIIGLPGMLQANVNGAVQLTGVLYVPDAVINVAGSCRVFGGLAGAGMTVNGDSLLRFDEDLRGR
jgi:hypothetical protein